MANTPLRTAIVGLRGMGMRHALTLATLPAYAVIAGCDLNAAHAQLFAQELPEAQFYTDYNAMLSAEKPDVVVVATNTVTHAALAIKALEAGTRGVYCEKPMATNLADAQRMVELAQERGAALAVNHQRRLLPVFRTMRRLLAEGAIGEATLIRGGCAGDVLSDGTHLVDTVRHLAGDAPVGWVFAQIERAKPGPDAPRGMGFDVSGGWRYGHPAEDGAFSVLEFEDGLRAELLTGIIQPRGRPYQDYEVFGTRGQLRRAGDRADPPLEIWTEDTSGWQPVAVEESTGDDFSSTMVSIFQQFARSVNEGADHPLQGESALRDQEIVMAIYESARLHKRIQLPLGQPRFPLELMIESGAL